MNRSVYNGDVDSNPPSAEAQLLKVCDARFIAVALSEPFQEYAANVGITRRKILPWIRTTHAATRVNVVASRWKASRFAGTGRW